VIIRAREVVPGAVWAWSIPIRPGETGQLIERGPCKCLEGRHGGVHWHWDPSVRLVPPGNQPFGRREWAAPAPRFEEYSRV
jgi:hypothetical protein